MTFPYATDTLREPMKPHRRKHRIPRVGFYASRKGTRSAGRSSHVAGLGAAYAVEDNLEVLTEGDYDGVMGASDIEVAERFGVALEAAVRTNDREIVYPLLAPDVEWVTPKRTLHGIDEMRREWTWGSSPESFDYEFEKGDWVDDGDGRRSCDVREIYRLKDTGDFAYSHRRRIQLTIHDGKITRYEMVG